MNQFSTRQIATNVLSNWGGAVVTLVLSFVASPFIVARLGDSAYGLWVLTASIAGYLSLLDIGVRGAISRYIAMFSARGEDVAASRTATSALQIFSVMALIAVVVSSVLAAGANDWFSIPAAYRDAARIVLLLTGFSVGVTLISGAYAGIVVARHRIDLINVVDSAIGVSRVVATILLLFSGYSIVAMALAHFALTVVRTGWLAWLSRRLYPALRIGFSGFDREHVRLILSFSLFSFLIHVSGRLIYYTDGLVIAAFLPVNALTFFAIGANLVDYARMLVSSVSTATSPIASTLDGSGDEARLQALLVHSAKFSMMILMPIAITFIIRGDVFVGLWMGPSYAERSGRVLAILALPLLFHGAAHGIGGLMLGAGRHKPMIPAMLIEAGLNLVLSIVLVHKIGIEGVAWGTAIPSILSSAFFWPFYLGRAVGIPVTKYTKEVWFQPWIASVPCAALTILVDRAWTATGLFQYFVQVGLCVVPTVAAYWWVCFSGPEREALRDKAGRAFQRLGRAESAG